MRTNFLFITIGLLLVLGAIGFYIDFNALLHFLVHFIKHPVTYIGIGCLLCSFFLFREFLRLRKEREKSI